MRDDIAIVGMACRFPGALNVNQYWRLLMDPRAQFGRVPDTRWRRAALFSDDPRDASAAYTDTMALLPDVGHFDAEHYGVPPRRARSLDPQHRLLIDLAREAIQDAGWETGGFDREETSVITALTESGYRQLSTMGIRMRQLAGGEFGARATGTKWQESVGAVDELHGSSAAGLLLNMGPNSISSIFGLHGESFALDSACSGGLTAVANAVYALRAGRCRIALAGGAQLILTPDLLVGLCRIGAVSRTGRCLPFGAQADGFVLGEGAGLLVLRPLADAQAADDRVYAVIRGVGAANDGAVPGGMRPQAAGQLRALRRAYRDADLAPDSVGYLEAHGTGTEVGDPVERDALRQLRAGWHAPAHLGAVKAVLGHSLAAAGMAGLIKTVLAVHRGVIPPQPPFETAEPAGLRAAGLVVPRAPTEWGGAGQPRRAGVSAFGFGGMGVHLVVEESPPSPVAAHGPTAGAAAERGDQLLVLDARDRAGLARLAREVAHTIGADGLPAAQVADTLARRAPLTERLAVVARDAATAADALLSAAAALEAGRSGELGPGQAAGTAPAGGWSADTVLPAPPTPDRGGAMPPADLALRAVTGQGLRAAPGPLSPCTLPPSPLAPRHHWVVDLSARDLGEAPCPAPVPRGPAAGDGPAVSVVLEEVSRTSVLPLHDLNRRMALTSDLGFDSLMLQELEAGLGKRVPGFTTDEMYATGLTVERLIALVEAHGVPDSVSGSPPLRPARTEGEAAQPEPFTSEEPGRWSAATACIDDFPEVARFEERADALLRGGADFPYFRVHEGNILDRTVVGGREFLSFGSYNYLGLSGHPEVGEAARRAVDRYGTSVSASRVLSGERELTVRLERTLADFLGVEDCLVLVSGYSTNVTALGHLLGPDDLVLHDALAHNSILRGCALSGAARRPFAHNDTAALERLLRANRARYRRVLIVVEGAYSMDGDLVDLPAVIELKKRYGALLMVDEAHSVGTVGECGRGVGEFFGVERSDVDLWMGTLSKAFASCGGYLGGSARTVRWLRHTLPGFVYSVGLSPANAAAALAAAEVIVAEPGRVRALRHNADLFRDLAVSAGLPIGTSRHTPIVPCVLGDSDRTLRVADRIYARGVIADAIFHPAVEEGQARLRFFITSEHRVDDIGRAVRILAEEVASRGD
ncbi:aminotransferase class I/II-fold pyridoxal phosphate-dependent enzyme [Streptomyces rubiginosohelvolus]